MTYSKIKTELISGNLECPCGCGTTVKREVIEDLRHLCSALSRYHRNGVSVYIHSGGRCLDHHREIYRKMGWAPESIPMGSHHLSPLVDAVDCTFTMSSGCEYLDHLEIAYLIQHHYNFLRITHFHGIGLMTNSLHLDQRLRETTWTKIMTDAKDSYVYDIDFHELVIDKRKELANAI
jgi:hypothetical protein